MKRILSLSIAVGIMVYAVAVLAQPAAMTAPAMTPATAPVPAMKAPKTPDPAVTMAPAATMTPVSPAMAPATAAQPASAAMQPAMAPEPAMAPAKPAAPSTAPADTKTEPAKATPKESGWDKADKWVSRITQLLLACLTIIGLILGWTKQADWRQKLKTERWQKLLGYADKAFPTVESLAKATPWKGDDKLVEFLKRINDWLKGENDKELSAEEMALLKREAADKAAALKAENGDKDKVDPKAVTRG